MAEIVLNWEPKLSPEGDVAILGLKSDRQIERINWEKMDLRKGTWDAVSPVQIRGRDSFTLEVTTPAGRRGFDIYQARFYSGTAMKFVQYNNERPKPWWARWYRR